MARSKPKSVLLVLALAPLSRAQRNFTTLTDAFPWLPGLDITGPSGPGRMDLKRCYGKAINSSFAIANGNLELVDPAFFSPGTTAESYLQITREQPVGCLFMNTVNSGCDFSAIPGVSAPYEWTEDHCSGWQLSNFSELSQWLGPLVMFIVPALAFSDAVPRRRSLHVGDLFRPQPGFLNFVKSSLGLMVIAIVRSAEYVVWSAVCLAIPGPIILNSLYETYLSRLVIRHLSHLLDENRIDPEHALLLLFTLLFWHLDIDEAREIDLEPGQRPGTLRRTSIWDAMEDLSTGQGSVCSRATSCCDGSGSNVSPGDLNSKGNTSTTTTVSLRCIQPGACTELNQPRQLLAMLGKKNSSNLVNGLVVWYLVGFGYNIMEIMSDAGNNDHAHALSLGMLWMVMAYVTIASSFTIAGKNGGAFDAVMASLGKDVCPRSQWPWNRAANATLWTNHSIKACEGRVRQELEGLTTPSFWEWVTIVSTGLAIVLVPCVFAFLNFLFTPTIGLACRSLTVLVYMICQVILTAVWAPSIGSSAPKENPSLRSARCLGLVGRFLFRGLIVFTGFVIVGGTTLQLVGVYRNTFCALTTYYWTRLGDPLARVNLGQNSIEDIRSANTWWLLLGGISALSLFLFTVTGFYIQRTLRGMFEDNIKKLESYLHRRASVLSLTQDEKRSDP